MCTFVCVCVCGYIEDVNLLHDLCKLKKYCKYPVAYMYMYLYYYNILLILLYTYLYY